VHHRDDASPEKDQQMEDGYMVRYLPAQLLRDLNIVDTPGTNVILERQQRLTEEYVPRADMVLFTMSAGRGMPGGRHNAEVGTRQHAARLAVLHQCKTNRDLWCADRPFTDSEVRFLKYIRQWGKKVVFLVNKVDILTGDDEVSSPQTGSRVHDVASHTICNDSRSMRT
jgi:predicted GTPase